MAEKKTEGVLELPCMVNREDVLACETGEPSFVTVSCSNRFHAYSVMLERDKVIRLRDALSTWLDEYEGLGGE